MLAYAAKLNNITHLYYVYYFEYFPLNISILYTYNFYLIIIIIIIFFFSLHCHLVLYLKIFKQGVCLFFFFFDIINFYRFVLLTHFYELYPKFNVRNKIEK